MFASSKSSEQTVPVVPDPYFSYVPLLLKSASTNGKQNNTFLDSSTNNYTITRNGTPTQGAVTPYWPDGQWSNYFSSSYLSVADSSNLRFGSANFTIEAWIYRTASGVTHTIACKGSSTGPTGWVFQVSSANKLVFIDTSTSITGATSLSANTWYYVAVVRAGTGANQTTLYLNGTSDGTGTSATTFSQTDAMRIGTDRSAANGFAGYVSNLRLSNTNLTISSIPAAPLTTSGSTIFLSCGYNRFVDGSSVASAITIGSGTPIVQAFQPFSPTNPYSAVTYAGSGYLNGSSDYLTGTSPNLSGTWTVEFWVYSVSSAATQTMISFNSGANSGISISKNSSNQLVVDNGVIGQSAWTSATIFNNAWNHVAIVRNGTTTTGYINGVVAGSHTFTPSTTNSFSIGRFNAAGFFQYFPGYLSNLRVVNAVAVYTGSFSPPTLAPLTTSGSTSAASYPSTTNVNTSFAASDTSLLTNFTNAGIYDAAVQNNAITVGDAQSSTTQYKWSPTSIKFDGTGDYLTMPTTNIQALAGAFTIEAWVYFSAISGTAQTLCGKWNTSLLGWLIQITSSNVSFSYGNGVTFTAALNYATTLTSGTWYYLAITRNSSNSVQAYINGSAIGSAQTASGSLNSTAAFAIGINLDGTQQPFNGYIQDFRITNGVARTITTPTTTFATR
jgi:hypothetical protein